jgi:nucleoside-diphosphate-sugar epimerase
LKALVTGGAGYIGSTLIPALLDKGYEVKCLDRFFFGSESLNPVVANPRLELIRDDVRWFNSELLTDVDVVIDLAALSNDPSGELDPNKTLEINYQGRVRVAELSKQRGVKRYVLASSCSVYGFQDGMLDENSSVNPLTTYAKANIMAEENVLPLADSRFTVTVLRLATVFGLSGRMRFDLAINGITLGLFKTGKIPVMRDGNQWRPFIHVKDAAKGFITAIENPSDIVNRQIFNIGSNEQNHQILPLAESIGESVGIPFDIEWYGSPDNRSYRIVFDKAKRALNFSTSHTPGEAAKEIYASLKDGRITDSLKTRTLEWYKHLLEAQALIKEVSLRERIL